jgi:predicted nucleic acid-binding protein
MTVEAHAIWGWPMSGMANRLKRPPTEVRQLRRYRLALDELTALGIQALAVSQSMVSVAADISQQFGLLTNDALIVAAMRDQGLTLLASNDADFDRVTGLTRFSPV